MIPLCGRSGSARAWAEINNDDAAFEIVSRKWSYHSSGRPVSFIRGKLVYMNRFICKIVDDKNSYIKHINGNTLDLRRENLKVCHRGENLDRVIRNGVSKEQYNKILLKQDGRCAICETKPHEKDKIEGSGKMPVRQRSLAVDHCHDTGRIRGLLCFHCNTGIGRFNDDTRLLDSAISYLENASLEINLGLGPEKIIRPIILKNLPDNIKAIPLFDRKKNIKDYFVIDSSDYNKVSEFKWSLATTGKVVRTEKKNGKSKTIYLHRFILGIDQSCSDWVKSRNKDMLDYRKSNLRVRDRSSGNVKQNWRDINIYREYGIDEDIFIEISKQQNDICAICKNMPKNGRGNFKLQIDHCHNSKKVRGLLCPECNLGIGLMQDSVEILKNSINYLNKQAYM